MDIIDKNLIRTIVNSSEDPLTDDLYHESGLPAQDFIARIVRMVEDKLAVVYKDPETRQLRIMTTAKGDQYVKDHIETPIPGNDDFQLCYDLQLSMSYWYLKYRGPFGEGYGIFVNPSHDSWLMTVNAQEFFNRFKILA